MTLTYKPGNKIEGNLIYSVCDQSFDFDKPINIVNQASLVVGGSIQLECDSSSGRLLYIWGYSPQESWIMKSDSPSYPESTPGMLFAYGERFDAGSGYDTNLSDLPLVHYSDGSLVCGNLMAADRSVEFAANVVVGLSTEGKFSYLLLKPELRP